MSSTKINKLKDRCNLRNVTAWFLGDEPTFYEFADWKATYNAAIVLWSQIKSLMTFINFSADRADYNTGGQSYKSFITSANSTFKPPVWCFDQYPLRINNGTKYVQATYYETLEIISSQAKLSKRPFWSFCQALQLLNEDGSDRTPLPSYEYMMYEAFSALAYGAQGIIYWSFQSRTSSDGKEHYGLAPISPDGKRTSIWYAIKKVNDDIKKYHDVFYKSDHILSRHTGDQIWKGVKYYDYYEDDFGPLMNITTESSGVLITHIINNQTNYLIIVNHSPYESQNIVLFLNNQYQIIETSAENKVIIPGNDTRPQGIRIEKKISAGGFIIYQWYKTYINGIKP